MIVLDENIASSQVIKAIAAWYPGRVAVLTELRRHSAIKDDAVEMLLRQVSEPTFVSINVSDFWRVIRADSRFAVVNLDLKGGQLGEISGLLRQFMKQREFKTKAGRMGVVALVRATHIEFYRADRKIETMAWDE
jgi:hypothetical protein